MKLNYYLEKRNSYNNKVRIFIGVCLIVIANIINQLWVESKAQSLDDIGINISQIDRSISGKWQQYKETEQAVYNIVSSIEPSIKSKYKNLYKLNIDEDHELIDYLVKYKSDIIDKINSEYDVIYQSEIQGKILRKEKDRLSNWYFLLNTIGLILILFREEFA